MLSTGICRWLFLLVSLATWVSVTNSKEMRVVCYYTNWSVYRPGEGKFSPQNINPYLCTHLIYAFGGFTKENTLKPFDKYQDIEKGGYAKFTGLKTYNKNLKTLLAIGGWNEGSTRFSPMVASAERRKEFAKNAIKFLRLNHFDGLDLDWEYPSFRDGGKPRDKDNYPLLVQELREEFEREAEKTGRPRLLLTMAVPAGIEYINKGFDVPKITKYLDWMNVLSYDFHSAFEPSVNHHAPLYSLEEESEYNFESDLNIDYAIKHFLKHGAEPSKLVLGIPTYGRSYTLYNPEAYELGSPADGPGSMGEETRENGYLAYYEICDYVKNQEWEVEQPNPDVMGPYAFKGDQWVGYDDEEIVKKKAEYVVENGLGGIMFWSIDNDDFRGNCHGKPYPLIEAGRAAMINAYGLTDDNLIEKPSKPLKPRTRSRTKSTNKIEESDVKKSEKFEKSSSSRRRNRVRPNKDKQEDEKDVSTRRKTRRKNTNKEEETSSYSSLKIVTPSYTTPAPPSTPNSDGGFKCEDEGFYPHPKDCKKYFWCLNGAGDSGIIAHQFTCPAGLYFNKAADSCDYTQNVLCKKPAQKTTTTIKQPESSSSTTPPPFTTRRPPPKITAATTRTTFRQTSTTTEAYEDEEYDEEEDDDDEEDEQNRKHSEEDPRVIKELIELIKKAGGIEELEKQFKLKGNSSLNLELATTKSPIFSKSLYERVLSKAIIKNTPTSRNTSFRNSRGPQSEQTEKDVKSEIKAKSERGKLQYTSVSKFRQSVARNTEEENEKDQINEQNSDIQSSRTTEKYPSYTNIRRSRVSTTTNEPEIDRNKILGEIEDEENEDDTDDEETEDEDYVLTTKRTYTPQYVNIRRQRPTTTEGSSTSKYIELRRGTTTENATKEEEIHTTSKYKILRRGTTTTTTATATTTTTSTNNPESVDILSSSTRPKIEDATTSSTLNNTFRSTTANDAINSTTQENRNDYLANVITTTGTYVTTTDEINLIKSENNESKSSETPRVPTRPNFIKPFQRKRPQLFEPRPFTKPTEATSPRPQSSQTTKVSESSNDLTSKSESEKSTKEKVNISFRSRGNSRFNPNRKVNTDKSEKEKQVISSKRRIIVTEKYVEDNRNYRPSEIADLSSLTAVDFDKIPGIHSRKNFRRKRPLKPSTSTEKVSDLQNTTIVSKRRRIHLDNGESTSEETKKIKEHRSSTTTESSSPLTPRSRKVIRRFRTTTHAPISVQSSEEHLQKNRTVFIPPKSILDVPSKTNEVDDDSFEDSVSEEGENIKLSESNIRENSDINSFKPDPKLKRKLIKSEIYGKSSVFDKNLGSQEYFENELTSLTYLSSTFSTEPSIFNRTRKIIRKIVPTQSTKIAHKEADSEQFFGRKRKIIRKLRPLSILNLNNTNNNKTFNETNGLILIKDTSERRQELKEKTNYLNKKNIFRPRTGIRRTTSTTIEEDITTPKSLPRNKTVLLRGPSRYYKTRISSTTSPDKDISTEPSVELEKSTFKYSFLPRQRPIKDSILSTTITELITEKSQNTIGTTISEEDQNNYEDFTTENIISTYNAEQKKNDDLTTISTLITDQKITTTENILPDTTKAEFSSTDYVFNTKDNDINFDINTKYTYEPSTILNIESTTSEEINSPSFITEQYTEQSAYVTDTTTELDKTTITSTAPPELSSVSLHSTLRSIEARPKFNPSRLKDLSNTQTTESIAKVVQPKFKYRNRFKSSTDSEAVTSPTTEKEVILKSRIKDTNRFNRYKSNIRTTEKTRDIDTGDNIESSSSLPINKSLYKFRKPKPFEVPEKEKITNDDDDDDEENSYYNQKSVVSEKPKSRYFINKNSRTTNKPYFTKSTSKPNFSTTDESNVNKEEQDINTNALKIRNKSLFEGRTLNPNILNPSSTLKVTPLEDSTTIYDDDSTEFSTQPSTSEFTEHPTTLVHIFAEKKENFQATTEALDKLDNRDSKIERIIEVNRIGNVKTKEDIVKNHHLEHVEDKESFPSYDKIGAVNRVTVIKIVDKDGQQVNTNETLLSPVYVASSQFTESPIKSSVDMIIQIAKIQEVPHPNNKVNLTNINLNIKEPISVNREERRFDFIGKGKLQDSKVGNVGKAEIIEGISHINVITPRPIRLIESSTIALEGLFQTEKPTLFTNKNSINEELLETENSKFVNVRILHPDEEVRFNQKAKDTKMIPIKLLKQDEEDFIMRAKVIEVSPKTPFNTIKIIPIKVEAAKKMPPPLPLIRINRQYN